MRKVALVVAVLLVPTSLLPAASTPVPIGDQFQIHSTATSQQKRPAITTLASGGFVVTWDSYWHGAGPWEWAFSIRGRRFDAAANPVGNEFQIRPPSFLEQLDSSIASSATSDFVVSWSSDSNLGYYSYSYNSDIRFRRYASGGAPAEAQQANAYVTGDQLRSSIASDSAGNFVVVWTSPGSNGADTSLLGVLGRRYSSDGTPAGDEFQVNSYTTNRQDYATVATSDGGGFVVVWGSYGAPPGGDTSSSRIAGRRFSPAGEPLGDEFQVNTYWTGWQHRPSIAAGIEGEYIVVWESGGVPGGGDASSGILGRRFTEDVPLGDDFHVNSFTLHTQERPVVAADIDGDFVVAWASYGSPGNHDLDFGIQAQAFSRTGVPLGAEFSVNTYTTDAQIHPALATDDDGDFVVTWQSRGSSTTPLLTSIQGRRFRRTGDLQGSAFLDRNRDGVRGPAEPGIAGIAIELHDDAATIRRTTATGATGEFALKPKEGEWTVRFVPPDPSYRLTLQDAGGDESLDSDADPTTGFTDPFPITINVLESTIDAGFLPDLFADGFESGNSSAWSATAP